MLDYITYIRIFVMIHIQKHKTENKAAGQKKPRLCSQSGIKKAATLERSSCLLSFYDAIEWLSTGSVRYRQL
jgi:hypothetical protein